MAVNPRKIDSFSQAVGGIADFDKEGQPNEYAFGRSIDYRNNSREMTLLPKSTKESGSVILALPKWGERIQANNVTYIYDANGNIYSRNSVASYSNLRAVPTSHGNGMAYFGEDGFMYYTGDKVIGRYGPMAGTPTFVDDYFGSQGGVPTNTYSLSLVAASSQYASRADTVSLSVTSDLALEAYIDPTTLPTVGNQMTLVAKWDEATNARSYKFDLAAISGYFGDGSDGALTISGNTTDAPIDSACTGTAGTQTLSATNAGFAANQLILIHQSIGSGAGTYQKTKITGYSAGTITTQDPLNATYTSGAQVIVLKQYSAVTVNNGITWTAKAYNGTVGGILSFVCSGTFTNNGTISADGCGYQHRTTAADSSGGDQGDGNPGIGVVSTAANGNGGGGGGGSGGSSSTTSAGGGGGGNGEAGQNGVTGTTGNAPIGAAGGTAGTTDLTTITFGGAGGQGGNRGAYSSDGGNGGGIIFPIAVTITNNSAITSKGTSANPMQPANGDAGAGGGGGGGSVLFKGQVISAGTNLIDTSGGSGGNHSLGGNGGNGGNGGRGRWHADYLTSVSGSVTAAATATSTQDNSLVTTTSYQLRLGISDNGTAFEYLTKNVTIATGNWYRVSVSWKASTSTATFYLSGTNLGTSTGAKTAISDNASAFSVGANNGGSGIANFYNGLIDDVRVWSTTRSDSQMLQYRDAELGGNETGLAAYYKFNNAYTDATANANTLTGTNAPTFSASVPFPNPTTRLDIDQSATSASVNTYTTPVAISEASTDLHTFVPAKDPQKSMDLYVVAKGTGNWTVTIHDGINRVIATATITNANIVAGAFNEFTWATVTRPVIGATYHIHVTSTVADGTVRAVTSANFSTADYHTYYQFLVTDTDYHPVARMLNTIVIGNERYVATYDGSSYNPHRLKLPAGWRVRCFAQWREYLAIGCWKGTNIYDYDEGVIFFWDGYSVTYNFYITIPEGGINALFGNGMILYIWAGYQGYLLGYTGGFVSSIASQAQKLKRIPKMTKNNYIEVMPGAATMWQALLRFGVAGNSDSTAVERGAYTWGSTNQKYPPSLSYDYPISTGSRLSTVKVGMLTALDRKLLIGWQDGAVYGVDVVDPTGNPFTTGTLEGLIQDQGGMWKEKSTKVLRADFKPLNSGESVDIKYKLDRATNWTNLGAVSTVGATTARLPIQKGRHKEYQIAFDLAASGSTAPTVLALSLEEDLLIDEQGI